MTPRVLRPLVRVGKHIEFSWRYIFNLAPTLAYRFARHSLTGEAARVLAELNRSGMAVTSAQALLGPDSCYHELIAAVDRLENKLADQITAARAAADDSNAIGRKTFIVELLGQRPVLDPDDIYVRFALQRPILQIANAYFGMYTRLCDYNVWHNFTTQVPPRESQLWHRDRDDYHVLKVFVYLSDVDAGAGPFTYALGTHPKGEMHSVEAPYFTEINVHRSHDEQMAEVVPPQRWVQGTGAKGTIIFADTRGYHKGGMAREHDRIMYFCMFISPCRKREAFERRGRISLPPDKERLFALAAPKRSAWQWFVRRPAG